METQTYNIFNDEDVLKIIKAIGLYKGHAKKVKCPCGKVARFVCDCGCLCCGQDPCAFNCGGSVMLITKKELRRTGIRIMV